MKLVCEKCGYEREIGNKVGVDGLSAYLCPECGEPLVIMDSGLMTFDVKVHGLTPEDLKVIVNKFIEQLSGSLSLADILKMAGGYFKNKRIEKE